ncbi:ABC transporter ATP-binding protein [Variovorax ureilyticus]|uniref:ABC transporter ATP-binding protein n=1 Tax=Variovorax ureilyticus TaxID=1836198 RepID=A0ABU8VQK5_9BURK
MQAESLEFRGIAKAFGGTNALNPISLHLAAGEFVTLLGPSGSGKTTLLNIAAGFLSPDSGSLFIGASDVTSLPARKRNIGMVFQNYALFPHMNVFDNVAYGLRVRGVPSSEIQARVMRALAGVRLEDFNAREIRQLSGGQQQRVALARALIIEPPVLLMDEPLGALDRQLRKQVQLEIRRLHRDFGRTTLFVTHDQEEALAMSDRIAVMRGGRIEQIGNPNELYHRPANTFVASFLGESNILNGSVTEISGGVARVNASGLGLELVGEAAPGLRVGDAVGALVRPESVTVSASPSGLAARVQEVVHLGEILAIRLLLATGQEFWIRRFSGAEMPDAGREIRLSWRNEDIRIIPLTT